MKVSLHNLNPISGDKWNDQAIVFLREYCHNEYMSMQVIKASKEQLSITLYEQSQEKDTCINALLVSKDLAAFTDTRFVVLLLHNFILYYKILISASSLLNIRVCLS